jgi:UTP--glucose-1-phosphate uridylyltransferase
MAAIRKALIPIAGLGTRMGPLARAVPKAMFPLVDGRGRIRPVAHWICAEAAAAGISQVALIVSPGHLETIREYFAAVASEAAELPQEIACIPAEPLGFGYAVLQGEKFVGGEPFAVFLGDHVHLADAGSPPCAAQVAETFEKWPGAAMIGMQAVGPEELPHVGVAAGVPLGQRVYRCTALAEKPDLATARARLATPNLGQDRFLAHCGIYAFAREVFDCLKAVRAGCPKRGELQLADAQAMLLARRSQDYYLIQIAGRAYDTGTPLGYAAAQAAFARFA